MTVDRLALLADLQRQLARLEPDLGARVAEDPALAAGLRAEYGRASAAGRTGLPWVSWLDEQVTQSAVAWLLGTVFVRFCEDNALVDEVWLAGPGDRRVEAADRHATYFGAHPQRNDRDWIGEAFTHLAGLPATAGLVDRHNPLWRITPSADAAADLVTFWRRTGADGRLVHDLADPTWDTRFRGDLYQDLSATARDRYALLQTPEFVEEFILDRTLTPAIADRGVDGLRVIDPTCGSGHFLLGTFHRLLTGWRTIAPGMDGRERVQAALDSISGVDVNPFAVAIARFRLTVAALHASGLTRLRQAPAYRYHLAVGDSLLHGTTQQPLPGLGADDASLSGFTYATEDLDHLRTILRSGTYDVVVGNPPYITVRDRALNQAYRQRYDACYRQYALTVPFAQRFFDLAKTGDGAGWVGQITANSFMKREFGARLIEQFLARRDLREVIDTSGAYIPGHGTPTVILIGRNRPPVGSTVRAVLGIRGEPGQPDDPSKGYVWTSIVDHIDEPGTQTAYVTVTDLPRSALATHPWSLAGGGANDLRQSLEETSNRRLGPSIVRVGFFGMTHADDIMTMPVGVARRHELDPPPSPLVIGEDIRDWGAASTSKAFLPYEDNKLRPLSAAETRYFWPWRTELASRATFGGATYREAGRDWWEWHQLPGDAGTSPMSIAFAFVATHNHFVLDRGGKVFKQSAPVIKLPAGASEEDHLRLLGLLNSSTACFWLKHVSHKKGGNPASGGGEATQAWSWTHEFTGTTLQEFPLPAALPLVRARLLDALAADLQAASPEAVVAAAVPTRAALDDAYTRLRATAARMVAVQEELDWEVYRRYGLLDDDLTHPGDDLPGLALGERAFEIVLARRVAAGEEETQWFDRHGSTPVTEIPARWPAGYRDLVARRIELIESQPDLALIERPECKRRWAPTLTTAWADREQVALRGWLLDRLEDPTLWTDRAGRPRPQSVATLADRVLRDADLLGVLALAAGRLDLDVTAELVRLLTDQAVPYLAGYRYTESGRRKRAAWQDTWALQRREDAGEQVGPIPVPPKYVQADFTRPAYWHRRGKLDVPKERFIGYPHAGRDTDPTPLLGWAGWTHLQQALALATLVTERRDTDGWDAARLTPLLAGLAELEPWLHQWHATPDPAYGGSPAAFITTFLDTSLAGAGRTRHDLNAWRSDPPRRGRRPRA